MISTTSFFTPVENDLHLLTDNLKRLVGARHPILGAAAEHLFDAGGKRIRPAIVLLVSRATMLDLEITSRHRRLAEITEMIHTASLVHDDVVDEAALRRNVPTVNSLFDNRIAVLAGDFLFAQSSWYLANLDNLQVVKLLSEVIRDFAEGEIFQGINRFDTSLTLEAYLDKSYYKTASLMANSSKSAAILSDASAEVIDSLYNYGKYLGLAFQIVDDILDFTSPTEVLGKPSGSDLISGNITAPALFAMEETPYLETLIQREFSEEGDIDKALSIISESQGIERSQELAAYHGQLALKQLACLKPSPYSQSLTDIVDYVLSRLY
ncbi:solanesyl diphosphate synthase [Crocosphaera watsonii WH 8501]|uniref:Trans-hexaprenyltranstransferase n=5 Tax=Crocosphaera watsonii TaxID=263511 RepID=Q4C6E7_CROWT|nr:MULTISPECIES: solanesyl diphosphate synthase [Crocosphaera]EAM52021.1 Trans-hexaprenyltranstransferase [Crocosphaera watsonii WH 8501]EHJ13677.1 Solanesyl diphosphate synthase [Crocosphaera watsonii WH 0003]MCH2247069.1 solanesyl diphosphate synthase [Crocosphaera sp.]NQZ64202.1 solanesyl diphosphate synthase [Crocosphaera sp.]CCQ53759.1 Solanesyl diphosphate synthase [Crocosphaera watsonii WH 0005]